MYRFEIYEFEVNEINKICYFDETRDFDLWSWLPMNIYIIQMNNCKRYR